MSDKKLVMDSDDFRRCICRMSYEILEKNRGAGEIALLGIQKKGVFMANRLAEQINRIENTTIKQCATGCLVNLRHVRKKERNEVYLPGAVFSVTMPFRKSFTEELMNYMRGV